MFQGHEPVSWDFPACVQGRSVSVLFMAVLARITTQAELGKIRGKMGREKAAVLLARALPEVIPGPGCARTFAAEASRGDK